MCSKCWIQCKSWADFKALAKDSDRQLRFVGNDEEVEEPMDRGVGQLNNCPEEEWKSIENEEIDTVIVEGELLNYVELEGFSLATDEKEEEEEEEGDSIGNARKGPSQQHKCEYCSKTFPTMFRLRKHCRVHTDERPFPCDVCEKKFRSKANLTQHKLIHEGIKPFECDQCGQKFSQSHSLIRHRTTHSEKRPFKCDECDYRCKTRSDLTRHFKSKHRGN